MKKQFLFAAFAALTFLGVSCSNNDEPIQEIEGNEVTFVIGGINSRTTTNFSNLTATFADNDKIGIYGTNLATDVTNAEFTYNGSTLTSNTAIKFKDASTTATFKAYYPYQSDETAASFEFSVQTDQSTEANFNASDFLTAIATGKKGAEVTLNFAHQMALIKLTLGDGFKSSLAENETIESITLNANPIATCDLSQDTPSVAAKSGEDNADIKMYAYTDGTYYCIIPAQTITGNGTSALLTITTDTRAFEFKLDGTKTFNANQTYPITIVDGKVFSISSVSITGWGTTATEDSWGVEEQKMSFTATMPITLEGMKTNGRNDLTTDTWGYQFAKNNGTEKMDNRPNTASILTIDANSESLKVTSGVWNDEAKRPSDWYANTLYYYNEAILSPTSLYKITFKAKADDNSKLIIITLQKNKEIINSTEYANVIYKSNEAEKATYKNFDLTTEFAEYTYTFDTSKIQSGLGGSYSNFVEKMTNGDLTIAFIPNTSSGVYYIKNVKIEEIAR